MGGRQSQHISVVDDGFIKGVQRKQRRMIGQEQRRQVVPVELVPAESAEGVVAGVASEAIFSGVGGAAARPVRRALGGMAGVEVIEAHAP